MIMVGIILANMVSNGVVECRNNSDDDDIGIDSPTRSTYPSSPVELGLRECRRGVVLIVVDAHGRGKGSAIDGRLPLIGTVASP